MKICLLSALHPPFDKRVFDKEAVSLAARGFDVVSIAPDAPTGEQHSKVRFIGFPRPRGFFERILRLPLLFNLCRKERPDAVHCNEIDSWLIGVALSVCFGTKCIFDVHEHYPEDFAEMHFPRFYRPAVTALVRGLMLLLQLKTDAVVLAKKSLEQDFPFVKKEKLFLVRNFSKQVVVESSLDLPFLAEKSPETLQLVHLGLLNRVRGWPQLIEALSLCSSEVRLIVVGEIPASEINEFNDYAMSCGVSDKLLVYDWMPLESALSIVERSDLGLVLFQDGFHNHKHALPHKLFDYMNSGIPVIAPSLALEVSEIIRTTRCGFIIEKPGAEELASLLDRLASRKNLLSKMGKNGKAAIKISLNWEGEEQTLFQLYDNLKV